MKNKKLIADEKCVELTVAYFLRLPQNTEEKPTKLLRESRRYY